MRYAQVLNGVAHWIFESATVPDFAPNIEIVDITGQIPAPQEKWVYQGGATFVDPEDLLSLPELKAKKLIEILHDEFQENLQPVTDVNGTWRGVELVRFILYEIQLAEALGEATALLFDVNDEVVELTIADAKNTLAGLAAAKRVRDVKMLGLEQAIRNAVNKAEVDAVHY